MGLSAFSCESSSEEIIEDTQTEDSNIEDDVVDDTVPDDNEGSTYLLPEIDLSNWKVTLPIGAPDEVKPPEILDYATNEALLPYMYNDSTDGSLVFYTFPGSSTPNSTYSRTELREQMEPGSNNINWTFAQGGRMTGTLSVPFISEDENGKKYRTIIMQIHGRLTNEQRDLIGEDDNNAPPVLKIYWNDGKVRVHTKKLKNLDVSNEELLHTSAWEDDVPYSFPEPVGTEKFSLEVIASEGRIEVILNNNESFVKEDIHMEKWGVFENYFKAGNYLISKDEGTSAVVKYYALQVEH
ncbi:polysaccharide lyase family 7 protein [Flagellimonas nanhaiensis]|uniref:Polysaccharide lyase family 7 protein n=2 Tax=Flagellimonas nanhaiensis TaxID=2292706 RepID=A0A371JRP8_9FLAO|nr:polysaccharide lyase family 7 protein [Allomuricauda nanhaiensis]